LVGVEGWGLARDPAREPTALPIIQTPSWNNGDLLLMECEGCREGKAGRGSRQKGREVEGTPVFMFKFSLE